MNQLELAVYGFKNHHLVKRFLDELVRGKKGSLSREVGNNGN